eukprot:CAMPEP_0116053908 /NCGR_PEP_ID=MMETSP0322-20121206/2473_1 /TAXON_ID=163516 /ORGANISM="Leptocylindrus danicus var. apora, Strain B651" /LENGTH=386 /DNA_ID=CAMNT_0003537173 /DNA_START=293 /DNA_END=1453 /DNA_ORIENTATION=+
MRRKRMHMFFVPKRKYDYISLSSDGNISYTSLHKIWEQTESEESFEGEKLSDLLQNIGSFNFEGGSTIVPTPFDDENDSIVSIDCLTKNYKNLKKLDASESDIPPSYKPDGIMNSLPSIQADVEIPEQVYIEEGSFLSEQDGDDYKKAIFGDPDELKKAIAERRKEEANDLKQDFIDKTLSEISSFSVELEKESKNKKPCQKCGAIVPIDDILPKNGVCRFCDAEERLHKNTSADVYNEQTYSRTFGRKQYSRYTQQRRAPNSRQSRRSYMPNPSSSFPKLSSSENRTIGRNISERSKDTNPSSEGKSNKELSRARSVIRSLESALESQQRRADNAEKEIERLKDIIKDLEETILITSMEIRDQEEESPAYFVEDSSEGNFDENFR